MGGKSSKSPPPKDTPDSRLSGKSNSLPRSPTRGSSRTSRSAWGSTPSRNSYDDSDTWYDREQNNRRSAGKPARNGKVTTAEDWANSTTSSYNLLDLQPYGGQQKPSPSPTSPKKKRKSEKLDKFRNITDRRDRVGTPPPRKVSPDKKRRSSSLERHYSPKKKASSSSPVKHRRSISRSPSPKRSIRQKQSSPKKEPLSKKKSPYYPESPKRRASVKSKSSPEKKTSNRFSMNRTWSTDTSASFPRAANSPPKKVSPYEKVSVAKLKPVDPRKNSVRRLSDVSTIGLDDAPAFRTLKQSPKKSTNLRKTSSSSDLYNNSYGANNNRNIYKKKSNVSQVSDVAKKSYGNGVANASKKSNSAPKEGMFKKSDSAATTKSWGAPKRNNSRKLSQRGMSKTSSTGSDFSFAGVGSIKSANQSIASGWSNFDANTKIEKFADKKNSLAMLDVAKMTVLNNTFRDTKLPDGPQNAYEQAKKKLESDDWEKEISGIETIVTISRRSPEILRNDMKTLVRLMLCELKNLRSQVCRSAALAWGELFFHLGKALESYTDDIAADLLQKAADTNKFIREGCVDSLLIMVERVSVQKALLAVSAGGLNSKSVVVRTQVARLMDHVVTSIGCERFFGASKETQTCVMEDGAKLLSDGSLEVRTHAKHMFGQLVGHANFEPALRKVIPEKDLRTIKKSLDSIYASHTPSAASRF